LPTTFKTPLGAAQAGSAGSAAKTAQARESDQKRAAAAIFAASLGRLVRYEGPAEVSDRRPIAVQIDRYYLGQHGDGVDTLRRWEPASSAVPSYFPDPPI
jgi:hypothetical protein